jgi:hypothetical protein
VTELWSDFGEKPHATGLSNSEIYKQLTEKFMQAVSDYWHKRHCLKSYRNENLLEIKHGMRFGAWQMPF